MLIHIFIQSRVCAAAFRALKQLTGVVNRDQLQQLLVEMDVLRYVDNNEVLQCCVILMAS